MQRSQIQSSKPIQRVMLIDDDSTDNFLHMRVLEKSGLVEDVVTFEHAEEALEYLKTQDLAVDLICLDINMPRMDGFEFLNAFRGLGKDKQSKTQIIILSTSISPEDVRRASEFTQFVRTKSKPLSQETLEALVHEHFNSAAAQPPKAAVAIKKRPIRVLLVEDQDSDAMLVTRMLTHSLQDPFNVERAHSLNQAIQMLAAGDFDACLLDLGLPDGDGIESLHQIRSVDARLPIVVLTGNEDEHLGLVAIETGAQDFVAKDAISGQLLSRSLRFSIARQLKMLGYAADANTDVLTGMPNRRRLNASFAEMAATCDQLCLALIDIDHFKRVNDTHGHLVGDQVLRHLASMIRETTDKDIQTARFGGEEFALLLPEASVENAFETISKLLEGIAGSPIDIDNYCLRVTASAGISDVGPNDTLEDILRRTDVALYEAKNLGRNRVCVKHR